jgi:hypothetical protein
MAKVKQFYPKAHLLKENDFNALNVLRIPPCDTARGLHLIWHKPCEDLKYTHKDSKITEIFISPFGPDKRSYKHQFPNGEIKRGSKKLEIDSKYLGVFTRSSRIESPSALIIGDSFTLALSQFLAESFQSTLLISDKNFIALTENGSFKDSYLLKTLKPDIVIFESVQRGWQGMFDLY